MLEPSFLNLKWFPSLNHSWGRLLLLSPPRHLLMHGGESLALPPLSQARLFVESRLRGKGILKPTTAERVDPIISPGTIPSNHVHVSPTLAQ